VLNAGGGGRPSTQVVRPPEGDRVNDRSTAALFPVPRGMRRGPRNTGVARALDEQRTPISATPPGAAVRRPPGGGRVDERLTAEAASSAQAPINPTPSHRPGQLTDGPWAVTCADVLVTEDNRALSELG